MSKPPSMVAESTRKSGPLLSRRRLVGVTGLGAASVVLAACSADKRGDVPSPSTRAEGGDDVDLSARFAGFEPAEEPNGDPSKVAWPDFVTLADPEVKRLYEFQIANGDLMRYMPCFCGCGDDGHRSNRDCYVEAVDPDGSVVLDAMAPT